MANFKLSKKNAVSDTRTNIVDLYDKKLEFFDEEKKNLKKYYIQLNSLQKELNTCDLQLKNKVQDNIKRLSEQIYNIENDVDRNQYLLDFFLIKTNENKKDNNVKSFANNYINYTIDNSKSELYNDYINVFNPELKAITIDNTKNNINSFCKRCNSIDSLTYENRFASEVCKNCGCSDIILSYDELGTTYSDTHQQVYVFNYDRKNHFQECLNQLQAKENTTIPSKIIEELIIEFKKYKITDPKSFTPSMVKNYLKKLKYNKYYEHIPTIINEFCGLPAPKMTSELEQQLKIMFDEIQIPFDKHSKIISPNRKNFLNYNYVFYKMCQLLNKDEFLSCFPLLKSREKLYEHDLIWKGICKDVNWQFIPSI